MVALALTLGSFLLILLLVRLRVPLAIAILGGAVAVGLGFGLPVARVAMGIVRGATQPMALGVDLTVVFLLAISHLMQASGQMQRIVELARSVLRRPAVTMAALPALIGLLPMPGGALFSAPMVASAAGEDRAGGDLLSAINYWFRHIWEHWWPLYPGVILAMTLTGTDLATFVAFQMPLGVAMAAAGLVLFRGTHPELHASAPTAGTGSWRTLGRETATIWVILATWGLATLGLALSTRAGWMPPPPDWVQRFGPLAVAMLVGLVVTTRFNRLTARDALEALLRPSVLSLAGLVTTIMVYQYILGEAGAAPRIAVEMAANHLPPLLVVVLLPAIAGLITGVAFGFVGTSFPIVLGMLAALPDAPAVRPYAVLAYACGHLGMMASPLHLCLVVSNRYFSSSYWPVYRRLVVPTLLLAVFAALYFLLLRLVVG